MIYFDTSYLLKCYVNEEGAAAVRELYEQSDGVACSLWGRMELTTALHRKWRGGLIDQSTFRTHLRQLTRDDESQLWHWYPVTLEQRDRLTEWIRKMPSTLFLRAGDALHLTCAAEQGYKEIYTGDRHLLAAAKHFGLKGVDVID